MSCVLRLLFAYHRRATFCVPKRGMGQDRMRQSFVRLRQTELCLRRLLCMNRATEARVSDCFKREMIEYRPEANRPGARKGRENPVTKTVSPIGTIELPKPWQNGVPRIGGSCPAGACAAARESEVGDACRSRDSPGVMVRATAVQKARSRFSRTGSSTRKSRLLPRSISLA